ncbi:myotubularin-related protein 3 isoform X2 [Gadus chalcogrammus]|uniref:myotubularin-related protein 3 isoform X2 n=1 Tax=Gadus chalcogrammus TaxID=1042646 RepID=UPI0024C31E21|nr:myotubularin-related protein 3 isoform X2 [Gadus chalcogrammus]
MEEEGQQSLECVQANQFFPKKSPVLEEENMQVPFSQLHGEFTEYVGRAEDAIIAMSNYRLHIKFKESVVNVPLQLIDNVECRDIFQLHVTCKDCKVVRCQFSTLEQCQEWLKRLSAAGRPPSSLEHLFSFAFHAWCMDVYAGEKEQHGELCRPGEHVTSWFKNEVERMGFDTQNAWRISDINSRFRLCSSYPQQLLVPAWITDKELENVAAFRSWKRFPAVVYRHVTTGAVIARCGQPEVSWWGWRNADDEHLVQSIAKACAVDGISRKHQANGGYSNGTALPDTDFESSLTNNSEVETLAIQPHKLLILDARSYAAAVANRAKGGGCECPEYYPNCEVVFMGMANIHSIRKSFQSLRFLCTQMPDPANWLSALESTKWLQHLSLLLKAALLAVNAVHRDHRPVMVHCSDGWDRTPQIVALSKMLLDPYYRTIEGFQVLVETDWLDFGHKFADRCGHGENSEDVNERCPVFLQWLDCVHQLQRQFPCSFEFNEAFLVKLVQHAYSCLFGTFLCNSGKEREDRHVQERTCSVWSLLRSGNRALCNMLYSSQSETVLHPVCHVRNLMLWTAVYLPSSSPTTPSDDSCAHYPAPGSSPEEATLGRRPKTRSFDNLPSACELGSMAAPNRRSSDPSLNEKWQDHRRSLELSCVTAGPDGGAGGPEDLEDQTDGPMYADTAEPEPQPEERGPRPQRPQSPGVPVAGPPERQEAELSVAPGVAEGQMENILREATKEEAAAAVAAAVHRERGVAQVVSNGDTDMGKGIESEERDEKRAEVDGGTENQSEPLCNGHPEEDVVLASAAEGGFPGVPPLPASTSEETVRMQQSLEADVGRILEELVKQVMDGCTEPQPQGQSAWPLEPEDAASHRTHTNGCLVGTLVEPGLSCHCGEPPKPLVPANKTASLMESSTETLTDEPCGTLEPAAPSPPGPQTSKPLPQPARMNGLEARQQPAVARTPSGAHKRPSLSAFQSTNGEGLCNGEEPCNGAPAWAKAAAERGPLSRQASLASGGSLGPQPRGFCPHRCTHMPAGRPAGSPEQQSRLHLDDDGLTLHPDAIQQRLRQMEACHQKEVESLKRQMQELRTRLENQQHGGCPRLNGDQGDEGTSIMDSEYNMDPNCLSRCSTELLSEASWEQVDKTDAEVTRWYPDHLAAQCYRCESRFWLASRKHHCSGREPVQEVWNCGNVFCASCCDQKIPVPSQQLFEPSRVCKSCYGNLTPCPGMGPRLAPSLGPLDVEQDQGITVSSD